MHVISVSWISKLTQRIYLSPSQLPSPPKKFGPHSQRVFHDILQLFACTATTIHSVMATAAKEQQKKFIRFLWRWKKFSLSIFLLFARDRRLSSSILITGIPWEKTTSYYIITAFTQWIWRHWWQTSTDFLAAILRRIWFLKINLIQWKNDIPFNSLTYN